MQEIYIMHLIIYTYFYILSTNQPTTGLDRLANETRKMYTRYKSQRWREVKLAARAKVEFKLLIKGSEKSCSFTICKCYVWLTNCIQSLFFSE